MSNCMFIDENGICEIANIPCDKVILCNNESVYVDKEDVYEDKIRNKI